ncbi:hypothetical protein GCM10027614_06740 [Micromonospora vulcania]
MFPEQAMVHVDFHLVYSALGQHELALASSATATNLNRSAGNRRAEIRSLASNGQSLARLGRHEEAARALQQALDLNAQIEHRHEDAWIRVAIAQNLAKTGRVEDAVDQLKLAAEAADEMSQGPYRFEAFRSLSELLFSVGDMSGADEAFEKAREVLDSFQDGGPDHLRAGIRCLAEKLSRRRGAAR